MADEGDCIFCRIVAGELPATKVYEDPDTIAFMDIGPVVKGHTLVIPREHYNSIAETPPGVLQSVIAVVRKIARAQFAGLRADGISVTQANGRVAGQIVPHLHFHVIPRWGKDPAARNWAPGKYDSPGEMRDFADRIRNAVA